MMVPLPDSEWPVVFAVVAIVWVLALIIYDCVVREHHGPF
jgi:hypothetical protein